MMRSRSSSRSSARRGLLCSFILGALCIGGCSFSIKPAYTKNDLERVVKEKIKKEAGVEAVTKLVGSTFWVYLPLEDIFENLPKPIIQYKRFFPLDVAADSPGQNLKVYYRIKSVVPPEKELATTVFSKEAIRKINTTWLVTRQVSFSMDRQSQRDVQFYCVFTADIAVGIDIFQMAYSRDLIKMSFSTVQVPEFQHRIITEIMPSPQARGDTAGNHIAMRDFTFKEFLLRQIKNRVTDRFRSENNKEPTSPLAGMSQKDIDRAVARIAAETLRIYGYKDFSALELNNVLTKEKALLERSDVYKDEVGRGLRR